VARASCRAWTELAEDVFLKPARIGCRTSDGSLADVVKNPRFADVRPGIGLLVEAHFATHSAAADRPADRLLQADIQEDEGMDRRQFLGVARCTRAFGSHVHLRTD